MYEAPTQRVPLTQIREPEHQLRASIAPEALGELADSMAAEGLHQPVGLRGPLEDARYEIIWGHRRFLAARLLTWPTIEAKLYPAEYDPLLAAVSENLQRSELTPIEEARAVARFVERGHPDSGIARLFRRSPGWVHERRALLELAPALQAAIHEGAVSMSVARVLADVDHAEYQADLLAEAKRTGATAATAEVWRAHYLADRERIVSNRLVVEEIRSRREQWKIYVACELCGEPKVYEETHSIRTCHTCADELARVIEQAAAASAPAGA